MNVKNSRKGGFTLIELLVVIAIIGVLTTVLTMNFNKARQAARDDARMTGLKELQLAIELYKSQYGFYPAEGCAGAGAPGDTPDSATDWDGQSTVNVWTGSKAVVETWYIECDEYAVGLVPDFIEELPTDPKENDGTNRAGYHYQVNSDGTAYKVLNNSVEVKLVGGYDNEFARCPKDAGNTWCDNDGPPNRVYGIYSLGAESW